MKTVLLIHFALIGAISIHASTLTPNQALSRFKDSSCAPAFKQDNLTLTYSSQLEVSHPYYVYSDSVAGGFVILSADESSNNLIGYSNAGKFDSENIPEALTFLLSNSHNPVKAQQQSKKAAIACLLTTTWHQDEPYNNILPDLYSTGKPTLAGCVGTALAQMINFHKYPAKPTGTINYTSALTPYSADLSEYTFDFDNMLNDYKTVNATEAQMKAVNDLYYCACMSVEPTWGYDVTTAKSELIPERLQKHFGYTTNMGRVSSSFFSPDEWCELIYSQLEKGLPVVISANKNGADVGHVFICDGYDGNGCFHINWGWGGIQDGYFNLSSLYAHDPYVDFSTEGYGVNQYAVVNIYPENAPVTPDNIFTVENFNVPNVTHNLGDKVYLSSHYTQAAGSNASVKVGLKFTHVSSGKEVRSVATIDGLPYNWSNPIPTNLEQGTHKVTPCVYFCETDEWKDVHNYAKNGRYAFAEVSGTNIKFSNSTIDGTVSVINTDFPEVLFPGADFSASAELENTGEDIFDKEIALCIASRDNDGTYKVLCKTPSVRTKILKGEKRTIYLAGTLNNNIGLRNDLFIGFMSYYDVNYADKWIPLHEPTAISTIEFTEGNLVIDDVKIITEPERLSPTFTIETQLHCEGGYFNGEIQPELVECDADGNVIEQYDSKHHVLETNIPDNSTTDSKRMTIPRRIIGPTKKYQRASGVINEKLSPLSSGNINPQWPSPDHYYIIKYTYLKGDERIYILVNCLIAAWLWDTIFDYTDIQAPYADDTTRQVYYDLKGNKYAKPTTPGFYIKAGPKPEKILKR